MASKKLGKGVKPKSTKAPENANSAKSRPLNVSRALGVKRLTDPGKREELAALTAAPKQQVIGYKAPRLLETKTPEQEATELAGEWYKEFVKDEDFIAVIATMIGLRRTYAVAYRELQERAEVLAAEMTKKGRGTMPPMLVDYAVQHAMFQSSKPFDEHTLMRGMVETLMPWLATVIDRHTEVDEIANKEELDKQAEERKVIRSAPVPIGFVHTPQQEDEGLLREKSLVLVGQRKALLWLLDQITNRVLTVTDANRTYTIVRFMEKAPRPGDQNVRLVRLAPSAWAKCAENDRAIDQMVLKNIASTVDEVDLLLVDDLSLAHQSGFIGRRAGAAGGDAHKRLRKWCTGMSAALVGCVPVDEAQPDISGAEYEQLRTFSLLRPVSVLPHPEKADHYHVVVGAHASVFDVPKDILDSYGSNLLVPSQSIIQ